MKRILLLAALCALCGFPLRAERALCPPKSCMAEFLLLSTSDLRSYGILIAAPESGCRRVRFRIEGKGGPFLGHTPPMAPGELALVRMGRGFTPGEHVLIIAAEGCEALPAATRRVILAKLSPDHSWRAAR